MSLRECLSHVLDNYLIASQEPFTKHSMADYIRNNLREAVAFASINPGRLVFKGSAGQGNWAKGPWTGIFDTLVTSSAQNGFYPVYLFREDMKGVYLSLNQGMTEAKNLYKSDAKTALQARAANFRAMLGNQIMKFPELKIDLAPSAQSNDTAFYEAGNICAVYYPKSLLPDDVKLTNDLTSMLQLYENLIFAETGSDTINNSEGDEPQTEQFEDSSKFRFHKRIERNAKLSKEVKRLLGYTCQVCSLNFKDKYGDIGDNFIEAHHLIPISTLQGKKIAMDPAKDFAVLCANCHRMIHRSGCVDNIHEFRAKHFKG